MSLFDTLGGPTSGLGMGGGMGGGQGDSAASSAAATATINPSTTLGTVGGYVNIGPFAPMFPGVEAQGASAINRAPFATSIGFNTDTVVLIAGAFAALALLLTLKR